ncbi:MAG: outer membrane beta-barrel protein [Flavobacteriales bacterium]|nr:outer membrane beta-barrel protein [Flavobacteriales bacterium]
MKKLLRSAFLLAVVAFMSMDVQAQAFQKGNANIDIGLGFGAYGTRTTFSFDFLGIPITLQETDGAASTMVPLAFEYGISNKFGIGAELGFVNYFISDSTEDSNGNLVADNTESVKSVDFLIVCNFHLLNAEKNDLYIGLGLGASSVNWTFLNVSDTYSGTGGIFKFYLRDRIFFNDHIGLLLNLGYTSYNYSDMKASNNNAFLENLKWEVKGINFGTGLSVKF